MASPENRGILDRLIILEKDREFDKQEFEEFKEEACKELEELRQKLNYYDKLALKWAGACMGMIAIGATVGGHFDKIKEKVIAWLAS